MPEALVITDQNYAGEAASQFIVPPVLNADTVQKGCIYVQDGIKKQFTIPRMDVTGFMQKRKAVPDSKGNINVSGQIIVPRDMMLYFEFNPRDFEAHWQAVNLNPRLLDRELPPTAEEFVTMQTMARLNEWFEQAIWISRIDFDPDGNNVDPTTKGLNAFLDADGNAIQDFYYFDGLLKKMLDSNKTLIVSSPATLVSGTAGGGQENVIDAMKRAYLKVPKALLFRYGKEGLKFHISYGTQQLYEEALAANTYKNQDTTQQGINRFKGYEVVPLAGMPDNTIVVAVSRPDLGSNLWLGLNSVDDQATLQLAKLQANAELYFLKGLFKADTQMGFPELVVLYTTITA